MSTSSYTPAAAPIAFIGGSSFLESHHFTSFIPNTISTPFGAAIIYSNTAGSLFFVQRHAASPIHEYSPPHLINHHATIAALSQLGVKTIIAFGSVGSLKKSIPVGQLLVPDDFYDATTIVSFYDYAKEGHIGPSFSHPLRQHLLSNLTSFSPLSSGTYTQTRGPRFETPAEIRLLALIGDIVGMTCASEATLAKEKHIDYAVVCMVDNMANGLAAADITYEEFKAGVARNLKTMEEVLAVLIKAYVPLAQSVTVSSNKKAVDSIVNARYVLPIEPDEVLENHSIIIDKGLIVDLLPTAQAELIYSSSQIDNFPQSVVLPGLVNCHTHVGMTLMRGFADDYCLHDWLTQHIWPTEAKFVSPEFVHDSTELALAEMIRGGITSFNDMYWFPEVICDIVDKVGIRAMIGLILIDFPSAYASNADEYMSKGVKLRQSYAGHSRINFAVAPHAPYTVCDENLAKVKLLAESATSGGHAIHTHIHETLAEVEDSVNGSDGPSRHRSTHNCRPLENLHRLGLLSPNLLAVHMTQLSQSDIDLVAKTKTNVVHCPSSNLKLASGFCPIHSLLQSGVNVALGTDSSASNNSLDLWTEIRTAALLSKGLTRDATSVPAHAALKLATINGAKALGIASSVGSLVKGKKADIIALELSSLETVPLYDVVSHLVYASSREHVTDVWVEGKRILYSRKLLTLDEPSIVKKSSAWGSKLLAYKNQLAEERKANIPTKMPIDAPVLEAPASEIVAVEFQLNDNKKPKLG